MQRDSIFILVRIACASLALCVTPSQAQTGKTLAERYPGGTIASVETAERALAEASASRADIEAVHATAKRACYPAFFSTACLDKAAEQRRTDLASLRPVEIEAEIFKRRARVIERDNALAERERTAQEEERARMVIATPVVEKAGKPDSPPSLTDQLGEQKKREDNIRAYEKKQLDASIRLRERDAKNAPKPN